MTMGFHSFKCQLAAFGEMGNLLPDKKTVEIEVCPFLGLPPMIGLTLSQVFW
jgi:hypothetical protein